MKWAFTARVLETRIKVNDECRFFIFLFFLPLLSAMNYDYEYPAFGLSDWDDFKSSEKKDGLYIIFYSYISRMT